MFVKSEDRKMRAAIHSVLILAARSGINFWYLHGISCLLQILRGGPGHPWAGALQAVLDLCLSGSLFLSDISSAVPARRALHPPSLGRLTSELWPWCFLLHNPVSFSSLHWSPLVISLSMACSVSVPFLWTVSSMGVKAKLQFPLELWSIQTVSGL